MPIAASRRRKSPRACARSRSFWRCISAGLLTLAFEVAKWLCQNRVIRSRSGCGGEDHPVEPDPLEPRRARPTAPSWRGHRRRAARRTRRRAGRRPLVGSPSSRRSTLGGGPVASGRAGGPPRGRRTRPGGAGGRRGRGPRGRPAAARRGPRRGRGRSAGGRRWRHGVGPPMLSSQSAVGESRSFRSSLESDRPAAVAGPSAARGRGSGAARAAGRSRPRPAPCRCPFSSMFCMTSRCRFSSSEPGQRRRRRPRRRASTSVGLAGVFRAWTRSRVRPRLELRMKWLPTCAADGLKLCRWWTGSSLAPAAAFGAMKCEVAIVTPSNVSEPELQRRRLRLRRAQVGQADERLEGDLEPLGEVVVVGLQVDDQGEGRELDVGDRARAPRSPGGRRPAASRSPRAPRTPGAEVAAAEELAGERVELGEALHDLGREQVGADLPDRRQVAPEAQAGDRPRRLQRRRGALALGREEPLDRVGVGPRGAGMVSSSPRWSSLQLDLGRGPGGLAEGVDPRPEEEDRTGVGRLGDRELLVDLPEPVEPDEAPGQRVGRDLARASPAIRHSSSAHPSSRPSARSMTRLTASADCEITSVSRTIA